MTFTMILQYNYSLSAWNGTEQLYMSKYLREVVKILKEPIRKKDWPLPWDEVNSLSRLRSQLDSGIPKNISQLADSQLSQSKPRPAVEDGRDPAVVSAKRKRPESRSSINNKSSRGHSPSVKEKKRTKVIAETEPSKGGRHESDDRGSRGHSQSVKAKKCATVIAETEPTKGGRDESDDEGSRGRSRSAKVIAETEPSKDGHDESDGEGSRGRSQSVKEKERQKAIAELEHSKGENKQSNDTGEVS
jgi:hypothetical protein